MLLRSRIAPQSLRSTVIFAENPALMKSEVQPLNFLKREGDNALPAHISNFHGQFMLSDKISEKFGVSVPDSYPDTQCRRVAPDKSQTADNFSVTKPIISGGEFMLMKEKSSNYDLRKLDGTKIGKEVKAFDLTSKMKEFRQLSVEIKQ